MSKAKGGTLSLGIAQDALSKYTPWGGGDGDGKSRPGSEFGCDLARRADGKIVVSMIRYVTLVHGQCGWKECAGERQDDAPAFQFVRPSSG